MGHALSATLSARNVPEAVQKLAIRAVLLLATQPDGAKTLRAANMAPVLAALKDSPVPVLQAAAGKAEQLLEAQP